MALTAEEQNIIDLEREHKTLFNLLAIANNTYIGLQKRYAPTWGKDKNFKNSDSFKKVVALGTDILLKAEHWFQTQTELEKKAKIPTTTVKETDFLKPEKNIAILNQAVAYYKKPISGMGIIPLIIWGIVLIIGAVSAAYIVSRLTVTTKDREELLQKTVQTCKDLNLTPDECAGVVATVQTQETKNAQGVTDTANAVTSGFGNIILYAGLGLLAFTFINKKQSHG